jgi:hypothetical protein
MVPGCGPTKWRKALGPHLGTLNFVTDTRHITTRTFLAADRHNNVTASGESSIFVLCFQVGFFGSCVGMVK